MDEVSTKERTELDVLRRELVWLLKNEVHPVLHGVRETLQECYDCLPFHGTAEKTMQQDFHPQRILMTCPNGSNIHFKSVVTLTGDCVEEADLQFKHKLGKEHHLFRTKVKQGSVWRLPQIRDAGNYLCSALEIASRNDANYEYKSVKEVFLQLDELMDSLMKCRQCLSLPKRKSIQDLMDSQSKLLFKPPLPNDVAISFYIHTSKLVLALYFLHANGHKVEITHRVQVEAMVKWLNEAIIFFTLSLQQCQQLKDKLMAVSKVIGDH
ncbi:protein rogdi [Plakobranchus ocellatus]|uniref:Protein rogdi n=1 Tax=Plakobranchus ocellatus TaxID=259542 RepID=A0AAV4BLH4_9GAST|nr:protein rogdi [Plakobranchus ocellatus]